MSVASPAPSRARTMTSRSTFIAPSPPLPALGISAKSSRRSAMARARSSAGEHYVDIVGVTGSIPVAPTIVFNYLDDNNLPTPLCRKPIGSSRQDFVLPADQRSNPGAAAHNPFSPIRAMPLAHTQSE